MVIGFSRFYLAATLRIDLDYSPQERLLPIRQVLYTTKNNKLHHIHSLESFFLDHHNHLLWKDLYKRYPYYIFLWFHNPCRMCLGTMAFVFMTEVLNKKYNDTNQIRTDIPAVKGRCPYRLDDGAKLESNPRRFLYHGFTVHCNRH